MGLMSKHLKIIRPSGGFSIRDPLYDWCIENFGPEPRKLMTWLKTLSTDHVSFFSFFTNARYTQFMLVWGSDGEYHIRPTSEEEVNSIITRGY
jgi:hypothetical protein